MTPSQLSHLLSCKPGDGLVKAISDLISNDRYLLEIDANERSITHCLAVYLRHQFEDWDVDCEYNRDGVDPKRLRHLELNPDQEDDDGQTVYPDIILHKRGTESNYLVVEVKKSSSPISREIDRAKLMGYKRELGYKHALFLELAVGDEVGVSIVEWME